MHRRRPVQRARDQHRIDTRLERAIASCLHICLLTPLARDPPRSGQIRGWIRRRIRSGIPVAQLHSDQPLAVPQPGQSLPQQVALP